MINYREAQEIILQQARSFGRETLSLEQAFGRVLTGPIRADRDYPPFPRATMDGYAVRYDDLERGIRRFRVVETIFAGCLPVRSIGAAECYRIMTGAAVPVAGGADILIRRENIQESEDFAELLPKLADPLPAGTLPAPPDPSFPWRPYQNIARQGEDIRANAIVIDRPCRCEPAIIGLLATLGHTNVMVERLPRIGLLTTGNEVVPADAPAGGVQIRNSNRWSLAAALKKNGVDLAEAAHAPDDPLLLRTEIERLLSCDLLIVCGGVSAGDADYVPGALESAGVKKLFHKIAMRPGKPVWVGVAPEGRMVFALPGNPFSCLVNLVLLIQPFLQACYGLPVTPPLGLPMATERKKRSPLDEFFPANLYGSPAGVSPIPLNGSGDIRLGMEANMLALHPAGAGDLEAGALVSCYPI
jgi:molybdopterin molybdotransferase